MSVAAYPSVAEAVVSVAAFPSAAEAVVVETTTSSIVAEALAVDNTTLYPIVADAVVVNSTPEVATMQENFEKMSLTNSTTDQQADTDEGEKMCTCILASTFPHRGKRCAKVAERSLGAVAILGGIGVAAGVGAAVALGVLASNKPSTTPQVVQNITISNSTEFNEFNISNDNSVLVSQQQQIVQNVISDGRQSDRSIEYNSIF